MKNLLSKKILLFFVLVSCSHVSLIGLKEHSFTQQPRKIVWLQIAGFELEHLALLKMTRWYSKTGKTFEKFVCVGDTWSYNLYDLRPNEKKSFLAQEVGKSNIKGQCSDYNESPLWKILGSEKDFQSYIVENYADKSNTVLEAIDCQKKDFLDFTTVISRSPNKIDIKDKSVMVGDFHFGDKSVLKKDSIYVDKSCKGKKCFSTLLQTLTSLYSRELEHTTKYVLTLRDFEYYQNIKEGNFKEAANILAQLEEFLDYLMSTQSPSDTLVLISGAHGHPLEFPHEGKDWKLVENNGKKILFKKSSLSTPVLSWGARAENFCGIYQEYEIFERIFFNKQKLKLGLKIFE
ncbi:MAG: hypothetical protein H6621_05155 [Halobacteriovoraceae bacterium]|nr:hypothetical protein [Halobacteriovoraceae bacterium]